jgi:hypothetical protein
MNNYIILSENLLNYDHCETLWEWAWGNEYTSVIILQINHLISYSYLYTVYQSKWICFTILPTGWFI